MKEKEFIDIIKKTLNSEYIGDDCAFLKSLGIVVTQDSLVENVHFSMSFITPYQLGYKSVMVNISDICASGAEPAYLTISLSLPDITDKNFVEEFYKGAKDACGNAEIVGGDITGSDKIYISVTAIGNTHGRKISSRSYAKPGYKIIVSGNHGSSGAGLRLLLNNINKPEKLINAHLMPKAQCGFSKQIAVNTNIDYAMMDTSDGLADALSQIADSSSIIMSVDFDKIPYDKEIEIFENYKDLILYGGEDYQLIAAVPDSTIEILNQTKNNEFYYTIIGEVKPFDNFKGIELKHGEKSERLTKADVEKNLYNHFKE